MPCPNSQPISGMRLIRGCINHLSSIGVKEGSKVKTNPASCPKSCWDGSYSDCPWFKEKQ